MMKGFIHPRQLLLILLGIVIALTAAQCGSAPTPEELPATISAPTEASPPATAETTTEDEITADEAVAADTSDQVEIVADQDAQALKATELELGATVVTDEPDVSTPRTNQGGEYREVSTADAVSFHPYTTTDVPSRNYQGLVYSGALLRLDEHTLEYIPNMAESYTISEDGLIFTFKLREGMKWSDGQPITAHDYEWTYNQVIDPANEFPYLSQLEFISSYKALDDLTLEIKITEIYAPALGQMSGLITPLPKHVWEKLPWDDPEKNPEINSPSVVSGPYKLIEWKRDQYAIFEANEAYWYHGAPNIQQRIIEIIPDPDVAFEKLKNGEIDTSSVTPEQLKIARDLEHVTVYEWWPAAATWTYMALNMRDGFPTQDINVRHGINYAIDKDLLTEEVWPGQAKRMCSIYPETSWVYTPDVPCYDYNPDQAIETFAKAGYTFQDGQMLDQDGQQLTLRLLYGPPSNKTGELIAVTIQNYLAEIGVNVEIQVLEWASFIEATTATEPDWDLYIGAWRSAIEPHIQFTHWTEENIPDLNRVAYVNKEVETLFKEAGVTYDADVRKEKYIEIQKIIAEESPYMFIYYRKENSVQHNRVQGIEPTTLGVGWNIEDWYIVDEAQN